MKAGLLAAVSVSAVAAHAATPHQDRLEQIKLIQSTPGVLWKAAVVDKFASQAPGASRSLNGVKGDWRAAVEAKVRSGEFKRFQPSKELQAMDIPESFDSAEHWPQCSKIIDDICDQSLTCNHSIV